MEFKWVEINGESGRSGYSHTGAFAGKAFI